MAGATVPQVLRSMAAYAPQSVPQIRSGIYPPRPLIQKRELPALVLFWDSDQERTLIAHGGDSQMWTPAVMGYLITAMEGDLDREIPIVDDLIVPLVDAFGIDDMGIHVAPDRMTGIDGHLDRCLITAVRPNQRIGYAGHDYYGAIVYWDIKFHRTPEVLP